MKRLSLICLLLMVALSIVGCVMPVEEDDELIPVTLMLDWVPNTNHTGIFVAQDAGYFEDEGLEVKIIQPGEVYPEAAVAGAAADFGISFQESVTLARADDVPIVSIAAVIQHNTSGFAAPVGLAVSGPADFEGLRYGAWGSPFEAPTLEVLMDCAGADFDRVEIVNTGWADPLALIDQGQIDLAWIFYGWQGFQAQQQGIDLDVVMLWDYFDCIPDYYTPVVIASEDTILNRPEVVEDFIRALSRGYEFAIEHPDDAAGILLAAVPELNSELVRNSQQWLSEQYQADAPRWGEQQESVWREYSNWMYRHDIIPAPIAAPNAFTNEFLP